jgi:phage I-like protein
MKYVVVNGRAFAAAGKNIYTKEVLRPGKYVHPIQKWELDANEEYLASVAAESNAALAESVECPIPDGHTHNAGDVKGWVREFFVAEDGGLNVRCEITDEEYAAKVDDGSVDKVSVYLDDLGDGQYTPGGDRVVHVALTPYPVASKQGGFVRLSVDAPEIPVLTPKEYPMKFSLNIEQARAFGIEVPEGHEGDTIEVGHEDLVKVTETALAARDTADATSATLAAQRDTAVEEAKAAKVALAALEEAQPFGPEVAAKALSVDPAKDRYFARARKSLDAAVEGEIRLALEKGKITKAGEEILRTLLSTEHAFCLSAEGVAESVDVAAKVSALLGIIPEGSAVPTTEMDVSKVDTDPDPDTAKKASVERMTEAANK